VHVLNSREWVGTSRTRISGGGISRIDRHSEFTDLLHEHSSYLYGYVLSLLHDPNEAEDVCQQAILVMWEKFDEFEPGSHFAAWATTIARFVVLESFRQRRRRGSTLNVELMEKLAASQAEVSTATVSDRQHALRMCMETLSAQQRELLRLYYEANEPANEIAGRLGRTVHSIHSSLNHVRKTLANCIEWRLGTGRENHD